MLRSTGLYYTHLEKNCGLYVSPYQDATAGYGKNHYYYVHPANGNWQQQYTEFVMNITTNSLGFREREILQKKPENEFRVFCFGDSFTEGIGATIAEHSWPYLLEKNYKKFIRIKKFLYTTAVFQVVISVHNMSY